MIIEANNYVLSEDFVPQGYPGYLAALVSEVSYHPKLSCLYPAVECDACLDRDLSPGVLTS